MEQIVDLFTGKIDDGAMDSCRLFLAGLDAEKLQEHVHRGGRTVGTNLTYIQMLAVNLKDRAEKAFECRIILDGKRHRRCEV